MADVTRGEENAAALTTIGDLFGVVADRVADLPG